MSGIEIRPEEKEEAIAAVKAERSGRGEIGEECQPLRLKDDSRLKLTIRALQVQRAEEAKLDHMRRLEPLIAH
jgi:hypothetical protein